MTSVASVLTSYAAPVTLLKPSFSRCKPAEKNKRRYSSGKYYYIGKCVCVDDHIVDN